MSPFIRLDRKGAETRRRRMLIYGPPNVWKTTVAMTGPKPLGILSMPGEKGYDTIPSDNPEILPFIWTTEEGKRPDSSLIVKQVEDTSMDLIVGKHGPIKTFVGDGIHKFLEFIMDDVTDGAWFTGEEFQRKLYAVAYRKFESYLNRVSSSQIPVVIFTCWDGEDADRSARPGEKEMDIPRSTRPDLIGQMAKRILGEFTVVFHQSLRSPKPGEPKRAMWQTRPLGSIAGASIKGPQALVSKIPDYINADYPSFEALWSQLEGGK